jgi:hypothetical protein
VPTLLGFRLLLCLLLELSIEIIPLGHIVFHKSILFSPPQNYHIIPQPLRFFSGSFSRLPKSSETGIKKPRTSLFRVRGPGKTCNAKQRKLTVVIRKHLQLPLGIELKFSRFRTCKEKQKTLYQNMGLGVLFRF